VLQIVGTAPETGGGPRRTVDLHDVTGVQEAGRDEVEGLEAVRVRQLGQEPDHLPMRPADRRRERVRLGVLGDVRALPGRTCEIVGRERLEHRLDERADPRERRQRSVELLPDLLRSLEACVQVSTCLLCVGRCGSDPEAESISPARHRECSARGPVPSFHSAQITQPLRPLLHSGVIRATRAVAST